MIAIGRNCAFASLEGGEEGVLLKGFDTVGEVLFDLAVNPMKASCGMQGSERKFRCAGNSAALH